MAERERLWSIEDLAEHLGRSVKTIYDWNSKGEGPKYVRLGRRIAYRPADVDRWLRTREVARGGS